MAFMLTTIVNAVFVRELLFLYIFSVSPFNHDSESAKMDGVSAAIKNGPTPECVFLREPSDDDIESISNGSVMLLICQSKGTDD